MSYQLTWITSQIAGGYAPMSYQDLEDIKAEGIDAIVNLCGEFTDLHEIEEKAGFEVYYLPTPDEHAPELEAMEKALEWLDESIYLKKKILVHCRHGHGRTGTFISAYLLRRGLGLKKVGKILKPTRANPTNYGQWKLLRKFNKKQGMLTQAEPQLEASASGPDLSPFLQEYEAILTELATELTAQDKSSPCGQDDDNCCHGYFELQLAESYWIHTNLNRLLSQDDRQYAIERALENTAVIRIVENLHRDHPKLIGGDFAETYAATGATCPLSSEGKCMLFDKRPFRCRWHGTSFSQEEKDKLNDMVVNISQNMYLALTGAFQPEGVLQFTMAETVSGRFVQSCFETMFKNR